MDLLTHLANARQALKNATAKRRLTQPFLFNWRSAESEIVIGWAVAASLLRIKETTLGVRLSRTKNNYSMKKINPVSGEEDILTVSRITPEAAAKRLRGRPLKAEPDWERLGSEAPGRPPETEPVRSVGKPKSRAKAKQRIPRIDKDGIPNAS